MLTTRRILLGVIAVAPGVAAMLAVRAWDRHRARIAAEEAGLSRAARAARQQSLWARSGAAQRTPRTGPITFPTQPRGGDR